MTATLRTTAEDDLLDAAARSVLRDLRRELKGRDGLADGNADLHANAAEELDASDAGGFQGGQAYVPPTPPPSSAPTTARPTVAPTDHPTLRGRTNMLRGIVWYDRNGNGARDSNVRVEGMGMDVEYSHGVGGVNARLVECDEGTGRAYVPANGETIETRATAISQGFDNRMIPQVIRASGEQNGKYNLFINGLERWYYVQVEAPDGFLFTSGICNDDVDGWECKYHASVNEAAPQARHRGRMLRDPKVEALPGRVPMPKGEKGGNKGKKEIDSSRGISSGRSTSCVYIDKMGNVEKSLNFGIMREGDTQEVNANVALVLAFDGRNVLPSSGRRRLADTLHDARVLDVVDDGRTITTRYLLGEEDKDAIGTVAAEVLAATLDARLAENDIVLDRVDPKQVIVSESRPSDGGTTAAPGSQLAVALKVRGHYSPPPEIDFDYIVQTSINRDTGAIRRGLRDYNGNCRAQQAKVDEQGAGQEDFVAVASARGARDPRGGRGVDSLDDVFSTACDAGARVPRYFETELAEIEAFEGSAARFRETFLGAAHAAEEAAARRLDDWAVGPVAGIAGLIVLLAGLFVFRRTLGPRHADSYSDSRKTKDVDDDEMRRFGEAGGAMDDGSVDSAFYSGDELDVDLEETEKERKMRRKRSEKRRAPQRGNKSSFTLGARRPRRKGSVFDSGDEIDFDPEEPEKERDPEETEKERKTRRKRTERRSTRLRDIKSSFSSGARGSRKKNSSSGNKNSRKKREGGKLALSQGSDTTDSLGKSSNGSGEVVDKSSRRRDRKRPSRDRSENKLSSKDKSQGSDATDSLGKYSNDSEEVADKSSRRLDRKRSARDRSENKPSSKDKRDRDSSDRRRERRGRNKRSGGDNAKAYEKSEIV